MFLGYPPEDVRQFIINHRPPPYDAEVEYIESDGVNFQRIDTGIKGSELYQSGGLCVEGMVNHEVPSWCPIAGIGDDYNLNFAGIDNTLNRMYCRFNGVRIAFYSSSFGVDSFYGHRFIADASDGFFSFEMNGKSITSSYSQFCVDNSSSLLLFGTTRNGWRTEYRIYRAVVRTSPDRIVRDFVPVRFTNELGESEGAMYDRLGVGGTNPDGSPRNDGLYRNQGTGSFLFGDDV